MLFPEAQFAFSGLLSSHWVFKDNLDYFNIFRSSSMYFFEVINEESKRSLADISIT